jgi:low temperature requirement protein LtrA
MPASRTNQLRTRHGHDHHRVTFVELFFDLVFVFAVTQLSHGLLKHLTPLGALQTALMTLGVWWLWMYTAWATNWLDPESPRCGFCCSC